ncbi:hypothetical protein THTE_0362 [Thermogutta terrifontis]|uniref:Uncharacterized protein n=1 Tax=Thermogutta terrifontis TaxID=1331910 RepID=A0A286RAG3_9BACT|nr:hypothetical protein THTE_0362 [Thermogutta terrifontis]
MIFGWEKPEKYHSCRVGPIFQGRSFGGMACHVRLRRDVIVGATFR